MPDIMAAQRRLTEWFIANGPPSELTLIPTVSIALAGRGTKRQAGMPRVPQLFKKIWPGGDGRNEGIDGVTHKFDMIIVGLWNCLAEVGDTWEEGDQKYIIHSEFPNNGYERKFGVDSYGGEPKDG